MGNIKLLVGVVLIALGFIYTGELAALYLNNFTSGYHREEVDTETLSAEQSMDFFIVERGTISRIEHTATIYGTERALSQLDRYGIMDGDYSSIIVGYTKVLTKPFDQFEQTGGTTTVYFTSDAFPERFGAEKETWLNLLSVWVLIFGIILLLSGYQVLYQKKEVMVRVVLGGDVRQIFLKNIGKDVICFGAAFGLLPLIFQSFTFVHFRMVYLTLLFAVFIVLDVLVSSFVLRLRFRRDLGGGTAARALLLWTYVLKVLTCVLTMVVLSLNWILITDGIGAIAAGWDIFDIEFLVVSRLMKLGIVLSAGLIVLELMLIAFIIRSEYRYHAMEMALEKVFGYTKLHRNFPVIRVTVVTSIICIAFTTYIEHRHGIGSPLAILAVDFPLLTLEMLYIWKMAERVEKARVPRILKGIKI